MIFQFLFNFSKNFFKDFLEISNLLEVTISVPYGVFLSILGYKSFNCIPTLKQIAQNVSFG